MIVRLWQGWTRPDQADAYEQLLRTEIFPGIAARAIPGIERIELLRRDAGEEVEFATIMWFASWETVRRFAGEDPDIAVVPPKAQGVLHRFEPRARHFDLREGRAL